MLAARRFRGHEFRRRRGLAPYWPFRQNGGRRAPLLVARRPRAEERAARASSRLASRHYRPGRAFHYIMMLALTRRLHS